MKKVAKIISAAIISTAFMGTAVGASSCTNISITGTGAGSNNTVDCTDVQDVSFACTNGVLVINFNNQNGTSGSATVDFNTNSGAAVTGSVTNDNNVTTDLSTACAPVTQTSTTPGMGGGGAGAFVPEVLPDTSGSSTLLSVLGVVGATIGVLALSRFAVHMYQRALK